MECTLLTNPRLIKAKIIIIIKKKKKKKKKKTNAFRVTFITNSIKNRVHFVP